VPAKRFKIHPTIKVQLGFSRTAKDGDVLRAWKRASQRACKPCWELKYCPYGPLVEQFPLLPTTRSDAEQHQAYLRECRRKGTFGQDGKRLDTKRRALFEKMVNSYDPNEHPDKIPVEIEEMSCRVFGHICPVVFSAEVFTETTQIRRGGREHIPPHVLMRVARRDNYTCQECGKQLRDHEIEFDHMIPSAKGGSSEESNLRVTCFDCNRKKGKKFTP